MNSPRIHKNKAQCLICKDIIESSSVHDFVACKCGTMHVDGGYEYLKRGYQDIKDVLELSEYEIRWRDVLDAKMWHKEIGSAFTAAKGVGYSFFVWNDRIYSAIGEEPFDTGKFKKDLGDYMPPCIVRAE